MTKLNYHLGGPAIFLSAQNPTSIFASNLQELRPVALRPTVSGSLPWWKAFSDWENIVFILKEFK